MNRGNRDNGGPGSSRLLRLRDEAGVLRRIETKIKAQIDTDLEFLLRPPNRGSLWTILKWLTGSGLNRRNRLRFPSAMT
jgi:hypothetical protein